MFGLLQGVRFFLFRQETGVPTGESCVWRSSKVTYCLISCLKIQSQNHAIVFASRYLWVCILKEQSPLIKSTISTKCIIVVLLDHQAVLAIRLCCFWLCCCHWLILAVYMNELLIVWSYLIWGIGQILWRLCLFVLFHVCFFFYVVHCAAQQIALWEQIKLKFTYITKKRWTFYSHSH